MRGPFLALTFIMYGCAGGPRLAAEVRDASGPTRLPKVLGCYEEAFEAAGFAGEYEATVSFVVDGGSGAIHDATVTTLEARTGKVPETLGPCLVKALETSTLRPAGEPPSATLSVRDLHISFRDGSSAARANGSSPSEPMLVGPRANRCQGLYSHAPPREVAPLFKELDEAQTKVASSKSDPDTMARSLQHAYDVALELRRRIELDGWQPGLKPESRRRLAEELSRVERTAVELGAAIGCTPSAE